MARRYSGPEGLGANHASEAGGGRVLSRGDDSCGPARLAECPRFREAAGLLPEEDRQVFDLLYYQGMLQDEADDLIAVCSQTVNRRWQSARLKLFDALGGQIPGG
jgi:RNA polymerase sigma-70 factor (ECF subfamily)